MKRLRPLKAKIKVIKRSGKRNGYIPLTIGNRSQSTSTALRQTATQNDNFSKESLTSFANWESDHSTDGLTQQRKLRTRILNWERVRESLLQAHIEESSFFAGFCSLCNENNAVCRCVSCGPRQQFCLDCVKQLHSTCNQFHLLEICKDGVFLPMYPDHCVVGYGHRCSTPNNRHVTLVDEFGVQHVKQVQFYNCESPVVTLIRCNFWPGSPERPVVGFSLQLMNLAEMLFLQSQVSLHDFTEVIKRLQHPLQPTVVHFVFNIYNMCIQHRSLICLQYNKYVRGTGLQKEGLKSEGVV